MKKCNIIIKLTGSIACFKACTLASMLVKEGHQVQFIATDAAMKFIGPSSLEGLTRKPVITNMFAEQKHLVHIDMVKWADLFLVYPASAHTINSMAAGLASNLVTSLFLSNNFNKPYWIAPAMNTNMYDHPATKRSLKLLSEWGTTVLPTDEGILACGDVGRGRVISPEFVFSKIQEEIANG
jgi:phosphopantothenoylcysteine decarboxylase/phosphopantothenate--cysteine ligase